MLRLNKLSRINIVTTTKQGRTPGRPRQFDAEQAIETAQRLFHARGYDAVSVADLTQACLYTHLTPPATRRGAV